MFACLCVCVCARFILFFHIFWFPFPLPKVSPVIPAICLFSCHTCLLSFQSSGRQIEKEREQEMESERERRWEAKQTAAGWQQFVSCGWHMNAKETQPSWQFGRTNRAMHGTMDGWMDVGRESYRRAGGSVIPSKPNCGMLTQFIYNKIFHFLLVVTYFTYIHTYCSFWGKKI